MNDSGHKSSNVPFDLPDDEDEDVFSSVPVEAESRDIISSASPGGFQAATPGPPVTFRASAASSAPAAPPPLSSATRSPCPRLTIESLTFEPARTIEIEQALFTIGRDRADLRLDDEFVSRWHAVLRNEEGVLVLEDMGSANGVYLRIADDLMLEDADELMLGTQRFVFRTSWDAPPRSAGPYAVEAPELGGNLPPSGARLIQRYAGGHTGQVRLIGDGVTIGRHHADICEPSDETLSSPHATIERRGDKYVIKDAGSPFGTFIRIHDPVELIDGDCFMLGRSRLRIAYP